MLGAEQDYIAYKTTTQLAACDFAVTWPPRKDRCEVLYCSRMNTNRLK